NFALRPTTSASILTIGRVPAPASTAGIAPDSGMATVRKYCVANPAQVLASNGVSPAGGVLLSAFSTSLSPTRAMALAAAVGLSAGNGVTMSPSEGGGCGLPDTVAANLKR